MPNVLTMASTVTCGHAGKVTVASTAKLTVNGSPLLLKSSIAGKPVATCATPPAADASGPTAKPCTLVATVSLGEAMKLTVGGQPVMLDTLKGETDGMVTKETPQKLLAAQAGQVKLSTV
jgi:hypothetical protein